MPISSEIADGLFMDEPSGQNYFLWNRQGETPFDSFDSLDRVELELIREEEEERKQAGDVK
jgi:hypothetical protein